MSDQEKNLTKENIEEIKTKSIDDLVHAIKVLHSRIKNQNLKKDKEYNEKLLNVIEKIYNEKRIERDKEKRENLEENEEI